MFVDLRAQDPSKTTPKPSMLIFSGASWKGSLGWKGCEDLDFGFVFLVGILGGMECWVGKVWTLGWKGWDFGLEGCEDLDFGFVLWVKFLGGMEFGVRKVGILGWLGGLGIWFGKVVRGGVGGWISELRYWLLPRSRRPRVHGNIRTMQP